MKTPQHEQEHLYTSQQLREAAAGEVLNCMGWAMECGNAEVYEWGRTLALRLPMIMDAAEDPKPPHPEKLREVLEAARQRYREYQEHGGPPDTEATLSDRFDEMVQELEDKSRRLTQAVRRAWAAGNDNQARNLQQLQENLLAAVDRYRAGVGTVILEKSEEE